MKSATLQLLPVPKPRGNPAWHMSEETIALIKVLAGVNQDISYADLSRATGYKTPSPALASARRHLESQANVVFETVRGIGLRRASDDEKVKSTARHLRSISRTSRRGKKRLAAVEHFELLKPATQLEATLRATQFEFVQQAVSTRPAPTPVTTNDGKLDIKALVAAAMGLKK